MDPISGASAAQMINAFSSSTSNTDIARCVSYTSAELSTIIGLAAGGEIQFQFAKDAAGQSTLVIAFSTATPDGNKTSFVSAGRICPPPQGCMLS
jgi:hypothetical protein